ncbi:TetR/AcrR family transcriptional regulator [Acidaminobacter sp. JC074]|uniref:TetR/AcrR family transcriptional regulator n=1 Tax=Acidaminobacter sp. JC074 TaxID=2530199 RepID=UPI001F112C44|nr:TetR/AcrR family transcriptional regulator [Acidaminobacter sp. JC074]MCH4889663.1 TetR/AcrR family transcriptional regulator [Acidaminobacter sp. JC074]
MNDKRMRMLMAAKDAFEESGYHETKMADIAGRADVGKGTLYEYFDSKQMLFEEMMKFLLESMHDFLTSKIEEKQDPVEKLRVIANLDIEIAKDHGQLFSVILERLNTSSESLKEEFMLARHKQLKMIEKILEEGISSGVFKPVKSKYFAYVFKGTIAQATMSHSCGMGDEEENVLDELFDILISSIKS